MTLPFDAAPAALIRTCLASPDFVRDVDKALILRDLTGRLRLVLRLKPSGGGLDLCALQEALERALAPWFAGPVLSNRSQKRAEKRLAEALLDEPRSCWPPGWPDRDDGLETGQPEELPGERWAARQAVYGQRAWLAAGQPAQPWSFNEHTPPITAFYSFKGGVGRSTLLARVALGLAMMGKRVLLVDLDLEAPGLSSALLHPDAPPPEHDLVDDLLLRSLGHSPARLPVTDASLHGHTLHLCPAGRPSPGWLEKLARLDTAGQAGGPKRPGVMTALHGLLKQLRSQLRPDHVLLDCRTGLNDLGGVALADLAHVHVLAGRPAQADLDGLELVLTALARRLPEQERRLLVVLSPLMDSPESTGGAAVLEAHRAALYEIFDRSGIFGPGDPPALDDDQSAHFALPVVHDRTLATARWLGDLPPRVLVDPEIVAIVARLLALCQREEVG